MNSMPKWLNYSEEEIKKNEVIKTKYEYDLKINNIGVYSNTYNDVSIMVSKPHMITSLIHNIKLDVNEYVPEGTSIEYYISLAESPTIDQWIPILPNDEKTIVDEKLFFNDRHQAVLRFGGKISNLIIKRDGTEIECTSQEQDIYGNNVIYLKNLSAQSIYTANYKIEDSVIEVEKSSLIVKRSTDIFSKLDDQNKISLTHEAIGNIDIMLNLESGFPGFIYNGEELVRFKNITVDGCDYLYPSGKLELRLDGIPNFPQLKNCSNRNKESFLFTDLNRNLPDGYNEKQLKSHYPYIEYYIDNNNVYFAPNKDMFNADTKIYATYDYIETPLRFKAILRNNRKESNITPILNSYKISLM